MAREPWQMAEVTVPLYLKGPQSTVTFVFYTFPVSFLQSTIDLNTPTSVLGRIDSKIVGNGFPICNKDALLWVTGSSFSFWSTRELFFACFVCLFCILWWYPGNAEFVQLRDLWMYAVAHQNKTSQLEVSWVLKIASICHCLVNTLLPLCPM